MTLKHLIILTLAALLLVACAEEAEPTVVVTATPEPLTVSAETETEAPIETAPQTEPTAQQAPAEPTDSGAVVVEPITEAEPPAPAAETSLVQHRTEPLPVNGDFVNDRFEVVGNTGKPQLLEFWTDWCPVCRSMKATVHGLEALYFDQVDFVYLDRESPRNADIVDEYGIRYQPVFILVNPDGSVIQRWDGAVSANTLIEALDGVVGTGG